MSEKKTKEENSSLYYKIMKRYKEECYPNSFVDAMEIVIFIGNILIIGVFLCLYRKGVFPNEEYFQILLIRNS